MEFFEVKRNMKPRDDDRHEKSTTREVDQISAQYLTEMDNPFQLVLLAKDLGAGV